LLQRANDLAEPCFTGRTVGVGHINSTKTAAATCRLRASSYNGPCKTISDQSRRTGDLDLGRAYSSSILGVNRSRVPSPLHRGGDNKRQHRLYVWTRVYLQTCDGFVIAFNSSDGIFLIGRSSTCGRGDDFVVGRCGILRSIYNVEREAPCYVSTAAGGSSCPEGSSGRV